MITVQITTEDLTKAGACAEGQALHARIAAMRGWKHTVRVRDWTPLHDVWLACACPSFASWLRNRRLIPIPYLHGANLYGANLTWANLSRANLYGANRISFDAPIAGWTRGDNGTLGAA